MTRAARAAAPRAYRVCDAPGCTERVPAGMLMCRSHWFQLPGQLRAAIKATWANRRRGGLAAWSANVLAARGYLANHTPASNAARITGEQ